MHQVNLINTILKLFYLKKIFLFLNYNLMIVNVLLLLTKWIKRKVSAVLKDWNRLNLASIIHWTWINKRGIKKKKEKKKIITDPIVGGANRIFKLSLFTNVFNGLIIWFSFDTCKKMEIVIWHGAVEISERQHVGCQFAKVC